MTSSSHFRRRFRIPPGPLLRELEDLAVELADSAGRLIHDERPADLAATTSTKSSDTDPVTVMDTRSETLLHERLAAVRPDDGVLGEEGASVASRSGLTWVVDPIDGTTNYLYGIPAYAVSVAVVVGDPATPGEWAPVAGAVCAPLLGTTWSARHGGGARRRSVGARTDSPIRVGDLDELGRALVGTGFAYRPAKRAAQARVLSRVLPQVRDVRRLGSAAIDLCLVADGRLDGYYESGLLPWDLAAGWLIVEEAGGRVTGGDLADPSERLVVAANPALLPRLANLLAGSE